MQSLIRSRAIIADGETTSNAIDCREHWIVGFQFPAGFDGVALTFLASGAADPTNPNAFDGGTYRAVYDDAGNAVSLTVAASRYVGLGSSSNARVVESLPWVKLVASAQTDDVTILVMLMPRNA